MQSQVKTVFTLLKFTFGIVPIVAGLDKFTNLLTNWTQYTAEGVSSMLPIEVGVFMKIVGLIEIAAGFLVLIKPKIGAYVVSGWLVLIALSLIVGGNYFDVAVRDLVMAIGAFSLAKLSEVSSKKVSLG